MTCILKLLPEPVCSDDQVGHFLQREMAPPPPPPPALRLSLIRPLEQPVPVS